MLIARGTPLRVFMGAFATVLIAAMSITFPTAPAAEGIDEVVTGSIGKAPIPAPLPVALEPQRTPRLGQRVRERAGLAMHTDADFHLVVGQGE